MVEFLQLRGGIANKSVSHTLYMSNLCLEAVGTPWYWNVIQIEMCFCFIICQDSCADEWDYWTSEYSPWA